MIPQKQHSTSPLHHYPPGVLNPTLTNAGQLNPSQGGEKATYKINNWAVCFFIGGCTIIFSLVIYFCIHPYLNKYLGSFTASDFKTSGPIVLSHIGAFGAGFGLNSVLNNLGNIIKKHL